MIECRNLSKTYEGRTVLKPLDLRLGAGICGLLGPNGAGKSTFLNLLSGLIVPDTGDIRVNGISLSEDQASVHQILGVLPEQLGIFDSLTIWENLMCVGPVYGLTRAESEEKAESLLSLLDLTRGRDTYARNGSWGMRKKTALAMALLHNPRVLLLDEPLEGMDPASSLRIQNVLAQFARGGATILLTSHVLSALEKIAARVLILSQGTLVWDSEHSSGTGSLEQIYFERVGWPSEEVAPWLGS